MPKGCGWTDQVKTCKAIEFANKRNLKDELLSEINSHKPVKDNPNSLTRIARTISEDLGDNGYQV